MEIDTASGEILWKSDRGLHLRTTLGNSNMKNSSQNYNFLR